MVDSERMLEDLQRGIDQIAQHWANHRRRHHRVEEILSARDAATWAISTDGRRWFHRAGPEEGSELRIVVLEGTPSPDTGLHEGTFQTWPELWGDGVPTVFVARRRFTPLWAGIVLFHELEHALEYREGTSQPGESHDAWDAAEGRVHSHEAVVLDAITAGAFTAALDGKHLDDLLSRDPEALASELSTTIPARLRQPPRSESETLNRRGALVMSAAMVAAVAPESIWDGSTTADLGKVYRRAATGWGYING